MTSFFKNALPPKNSTPELWEYRLTESIAFVYAQPMHVKPTHHSTCYNIWVGSRMGLVGYLNMILYFKTGGVKLRGAATAVGK